jgi:hypothetical protein
LENHKETATRFFLGWDQLIACWQSN